MQPKPHPGVAATVLPLQLELAPTDTPLDLLGAARSSLEGLRCHQRYRYEDLRGELGLAPDALDNLGPTVSIRPTDEALTWGGQRCSLENFASAMRIDDLTVVLSECGAGRHPHLDLDGNPELYTPASLAGHASRLTRLLEQIVADPSAPLHRLEVLAPHERRQLLDDFNDTAAPIPETTLIDYFERQVAKTSKNIALVFGNRELTYAQLDARANQLAWRLIAEGIGPEDMVALCLERSPEMVVALLATLKTGAAYLPLDPDYPAERLAFMIQDARPRRILTTSDLYWSLPDRQHGICLLLDTPAVAAELSDFPLSTPANADRPTSLRPQHPAYLIYTSGSTGRPKGVVVTNFAVSNSINARINFYDKDIAALNFLAPISFDISVAQIFWTFSSGAKLIVGLLPTGEDLEVEDERDLRKCITHLMLPAAAYASLLTSNQSRELPNLGCVVVGGDELPSQTVRLHSEIYGDVDLFNEYGATEAAIWSTARRCIAGPNGNAESIGAPIANTRVYVLDAALQPSPVGVVGELYIAGAGLARGYWNRPGLTAERFVANPFALEPGERLYRTGDLASWHQKGNLVFHGRADQQVKIRGFRIEPGEIEAVLGSQPQIAQVAVIAREDTAGEKRLVAYLVPTKDARATSEEIDLRELRQRLAARLPDYMIPAAFVVLDALPLTLNGKLDRKALPAPDGSGLADGYVAPATPEQILLCDLVAELLGLERVGLADNFFHLGGNSLMATRLAAQIRVRLGRELPIRTIFETPVLGDLARTLRTLPKAGRPLIRQERPGELPLSFAQTRLWFLHQLEGANPNYNIPLGVRLRGPLDPTALQRALADLLTRRESLRTLLVEGDNGPQQRILPAKAAPLRLDILISSLESLENDFAAAAAHGFDLANQIPFRATLFGLGPDDHALLLLLHHSAADGWSMVPLFDDLAKAYAARLKGQVPAFTALPVQYADYALWQRALLGSEEDPASPLARQIAYWTRKLAALPVELSLPTDRPRSLTPSREGGVVNILITPELHARLQDLGREQGATLFMLLQAALAVLLTKLGGGTDIPIGAAVAGRSEAALDQLVGFYRHQWRSLFYPATPAGPGHLSGSLRPPGPAVRAPG